MASVPKLTRPQISRIVNGDEQAIRFFEALIARALTDTPDDIDAIRSSLSDVTAESAAALVNALSARAELARIADAIEAVQPIVPIVIEDVPYIPPQPQRPKYYGAFSDSTTQTAAVINTAYPITFDTTDMSYGVSIGSPTSRVYVENSGVYNFQFSAQLDNTSGGVVLAVIWCRVNGADVPRSAGRVRIKDNNSEAVPAWNYVLELNAGDYFELVWAADDTALQIQADAATGLHPAVPSVILTVTDNIS